MIVLENTNFSEMPFSGSVGIQHCTTCQLPGVVRCGAHHPLPGSDASCRSAQTSSRRFFLNACVAGVTDCHNGAGGILCVYLRNHTKSTLMIGQGNAMTRWYDGEFGDGDSYRVAWWSRIALGSRGLPSRVRNYWSQAALLSDSNVTRLRTEGEIAVRFQIS